MTDSTATIVLSNDIKPQWLRIVHLLQRMTKARQTPAIVNITVLVDQNGNPVSVGKRGDDSKGTLILQDVHPQWFNVIRRLQQMARTQQGVALLSVSVLVDISKGLFQWTTPTLRCFEPKASCDQLLDFFGEHLEEGCFIQWTTAAKYFEPKTPEQQFIDFLRLL